MGDDFVEYKEITTSLPSTILFFSPLFKQLNNTCKIPLILSKADELKGENSIPLHRTKQMSVLVPGNLLYGDQCSLTLLSFLLT